MAFKIVSLLRLKINSFVCMSYNSSAPAAGSAVFCDDTQRYHVKHVGVLVDTH